MCEELTSDVVHVRESWQAGHSTCRSVRVTKSKLATLPLMAQQERLLEGSCKTQAAPEREQGYRRSERSTSPLTLGWNTASLYHSVYRFLNHPQDGANPTLMLLYHLKGGGGLPRHRGGVEAHIQMSYDSQVQRELLPRSLIMLKELGPHV